MEVNLLIDGHFDCNRGNNNVSFIYKPDVKPTYFNASYNDSNESVALMFIFH